MPERKWAAGACKRAEGTRRDKGYTGRGASLESGKRRGSKQQQRREPTPRLAFALRWRGRARCPLVQRPPQVGGGDDGLEAWAANRTWEDKGEGPSASVFRFRSMPPPSPRAWPAGVRARTEPCPPTRERPRNRQGVCRALRVPPPSPPRNELRPSQAEPSGLLSRPSSSCALPSFPGPVNNPPPRPFPSRARVRPAGAAETLTGCGSCYTRPTVR